MQFVVDENVSGGLAEPLRASGHIVLSVAEDATCGLSDEEVFLLARRSSAILITRDHHFANPVRFPAQKTGGIIYIRQGNLRAEEEIALVQQLLADRDEKWVAGKLIVLSREGVRIKG